jgi:hydroxymethylglutaryl-CoA reductase (NADPH)
MLALLGIDGSQPQAPGENAATLARVIASTVMAGELSLLSALTTGHLISSHMKLNRHNPSPATSTHSAEKA